MSQNNKQKGFTLIEMLVVVLIMGVVSVTLFDFQKADMEKQRISIAAGHLQSVSKAANAYIRDNYSTIMGIATDTQPVIIRVSDLVSQNYLQPGVSAVNAYQQATCALVLQPSAGQLTGLVVTQGGQALDDASLSNMVSRIGASAGGIYTDTPAVIIGARGGWAIAHANYGNDTHLSEDCAGNAQPVTMETGHAHVALWFENNDLTAGFLYREEIPGRPELNRMATNLDMAGNELTGASKVEATDSFDMNGTSVIDSSRNLVNIDSIFASGNVEVTGKLEANTIKPTLVVSAGSACSENSAIATDASGQLLSCQSGSWSAV
ncbi:MAG: shufflon system plasmid conjugative transfer pilus tip adhesin PilV, partial [Methyloprofundus sp.]|nr:shufflon system plasmid conjugative transfer pilus tip adhesin PilV [Methyloprofundus sp.]